MHRFGVCDIAEFVSKSSPISELHPQYSSMMWAASSSDVKHNLLERDPVRIDDFRLSQTKAKL